MRQRLGRMAIACKLAASARGDWMSLRCSRVTGYATGSRRGIAVAFAAVLALVCPTASQAQNLLLPWQNITTSEIKFGVLDHDAHFLQGKEDGADINPELILASPVTDDMIAGAPWWLRWTLQPRPTIGGDINTAGETDQVYIGATWSWMVANNIINPNDGIVVEYFFGPGFNDGKIGPAPDDRKALGYRVLFREGLDLGYQINPTWVISAHIDHISNGGLAKYNESINDVGLRLGYRF
jgi:lipid A 3-O-deacylase